LLNFIFSAWEIDMGGHSAGHKQRQEAGKKGLEKRKAIGSVPSGPRALQGFEDARNPGGFLHTPQLPATPRTPRLQKAREVFDPSPMPSKRQKVSPYRQVQEKLQAVVVEKEAVSTNSVQSAR
jgi:hypothetical protein